MIRIAPLVLAIATALWIVPTAARQNGGGLAALDANDDGQISRQEALSAQVGVFHRLDADGNGGISRAELASSKLQIGPNRAEDQNKSSRQRARRNWFDNIDGDGNDAISLAEYQAAMTPYFDRLDVDGNGVIDGRELRAAYATGADR